MTFAEYMRARDAISHEINMLIFDIMIEKDEQKKEQMEKDLNAWIGKRSDLDNQYAEEEEKRNRGQ